MLRIFRASNELTKGLKRGFSTLYDEFLQNTIERYQPKYAKRNNKEVITHVQLPYSNISRQKTQQLFKELKLTPKCEVIINTDPSHCIGLNHTLQQQYLQRTVYKGLSQGVDRLNKDNPDNEKHIQQGHLNESLFHLTDKQFQEVIRIKPQKEYTLDMAVYNLQNIDHGVQRLFKEYKVAPRYLYLVETAFNAGHPIYFGGINQYKFRSILSKYYSLPQLKTSFVNAVKYAEKKGDRTIRHVYERQYIWKENFQVLHPIVYQLTQEHAKQMPNAVTFGLKYEFQKPQYEKTINMGDVIQSVPDRQKIEKNAILELLLGELWSRYYTKNPFPYLTQNYHSLPENDKNMVEKAFKDFYSVYKQAMIKVAATA